MEPFPPLQVRTPTCAHPLSHSQYLRQNINFKRKSTLVTVIYKSETREIPERSYWPVLSNYHLVGFVCLLRVRMRSNANGRYAHYPSEVILDAEKVKSTVYCCWSVPGRASRPKMFAPKPLISVGNWLTQVYVENGRLKRPLHVCVCLGYCAIGRGVHSAKSALLVYYAPPL